MQFCCVSPLKWTRMGGVTWRPFGGEVSTTQYVPGCASVIFVHPLGASIVATTGSSLGWNFSSPLSVWIVNCAPPAIRSSSIVAVPSLLTCAMTTGGTAGVGWGVGTGVAVGVAVGVGSGSVVGDGDGEPVGDAVGTAGDSVGTAGDSVGDGDGDSVGIA